MSQDELDAHTSELLGRARRALSPTPADAARVLAGTMRVAAGAGVAASKLAAWRLPLMAAAGAVLLALPGGYALGYRAGARAGRKETPALLQPSAADARATAASALGERAQTPSGSPPMAAEDPHPADSRAAQTAASPSAQTAIPSIVRARTPPPSAAAAARAPSSDAPPPSEADDLRRELDAIRRVELALREGHPRMALSILDRLDREIPQGKLLEERLASFAMARCAIGLGSRAALVREFTASYPESVYGERVARSCSEP